MQMSAFQWQAMRASAVKANKITNYIIMFSSRLRYHHLIASMVFRLQTSQHFKLSVWRLRGFCPTLPWRNPYVHQTQELWGTSLFQKGLRLCTWFSTGCISHWELACLWGHLRWPKLVAAVYIHLKQTGGSCYPPTLNRVYSMWINVSQVMGLAKDLICNVIVCKRCSM